ncbi:conserved Plasmodium protein, unknown function [Plasmodium berghei]|uniref:Protein Mpv17, putative n=2 Tax=Plasmodium berghei TaxID=5821 RepID=A0A509ALK4_PLABA|nr:protein Mpv17, putative [Plasmodium berghei ANKA]CXI59235.1 conserved Plasmodium protein, unknown function [Plasmodium berghei]SCM23435.1 conserved Plasmodium protein, unknown function [Plasmodium berghei]SCN26590.1 conserved Plasmodium protein, unknown function [Plasmodium berghei]SCO60852.1 conserved Plasmodium protein, unknown function [Plasmodium berghei]SCO62842.1 conserved Plasmodium protein, unknown function [Plasmodium berghei]|eukprot:XP_034422229.1 protein Mpv17, putative [Plasmodium berghei ANKA]
MLINAYISIKGKHKNFVPKNVNSFDINYNFRRIPLTDKINYLKYLNFEKFKIKIKKFNNVCNNVGNHFSEHFFCNQFGNQLSEKFNYKSPYTHGIKLKEFDTYYIKDTKEKKNDQSYFHKINNFIKEEDKSPLSTLLNINEYNNQPIYLNNYINKENYIQNKYINGIVKYNTVINKVANNFNNSSNRNIFIKTTNRFFQTIIQKKFHTSNNKKDDKKISKNGKKNKKIETPNKKIETPNKKIETLNKKMEIPNKKIEIPNKKCIKNTKNETIIKSPENTCLDKKKNIEENKPIIKEKICNIIENDTNIKHKMNETDKNYITNYKNKIKNLINNLFEKHLLLMNSLIAGTLYFIADIACQFMEMSKQPNEYDIYRTLRMSTIGFTLEGPVMTWWYGKILANFIKSRPNIFLYKSFIPTLFDNFIFGPIHLTIFFFYNGILKKQSRSEIVEKILNTGMNVFFISFVTWTPLTLVNFFFVPRIYQATVVFFADFFWVIFLSWSANNK